MLGSEHNDEFYMEAGRVRTRTNRSGGVQGGISNGACAGPSIVLCVRLTGRLRVCLNSPPLLPVPRQPLRSGAPPGRVARVVFDPRSLGPKP